MGYKQVGGYNVKTNNVPRELVEATYLTPKEREGFDYLDWAAIDDGRDSATFFRYKGNVVALDTVIRLQDGGELAEAGWQGAVAWSAFNGLLVRYGGDYDDEIVVAYFYC